MPPVPGAGREQGGDGQFGWHSSCAAHSARLAGELSLATRNTHGTYNKRFVSPNSFHLLKQQQGRGRLGEGNRGVRFFVSCGKGAGQCRDHFLPPSVAGSFATWWFLGRLAALSGALG